MVRYAIIGAGAVSDYHHVPGIRLDQRAELVAVCDPNRRAARPAAQGLGHRRRSRPKYQDIANDPDIDAVIIATPNFTHHAIAVACAQGGKH